MMEADHCKASISFEAEQGEGGTNETTLDYRVKRSAAK